jgi:arylsulfatase A-like enzyme
MVNQRIRVSIVGMVILGLTVCFHGYGQSDKTSRQRPNFIILISDDQRYDQLSYADRPIIPELHTPNIDKLAKSGVYFRNAFVTSPICAVSRASIATGMYAGTHGMNHFQTPIRPDILSKSYSALLHQNGYRTGMLGKWGVGTEGMAPYFDVFNAWTTQGNYFMDTDTGKIHNSEWLSIQARKFLQGVTREQPFCLTVCFKSPHHPYEPDKRDAQLFNDVIIPKRKSDTREAYASLSASVMEHSLNRWCYFDERKDDTTKDRFEKNFLRCVMSLDRGVGQIYDALKELKLDKNTYVIFISDNGYLWGEHGLGGKWVLYEESVRVPLLITGPGIPTSLKGRKLNNLTLNIDIAPTVLELAGITPPAQMDGKSLYPALKGNQATDRQDFFMEHVGVVEVKETPIPDSKGIRTKEWKYIRYTKTQPATEEMYHLATDPMELHNLIDDKKYEAIRKQLREKYAAYEKKLTAIPGG